MLIIFWIRGAFYDDFLFDIPKAEVDLNRAIELDPDWMLIKGWFYVLQGRVQEAIQLLMKVEDDSQDMLALMGKFHLFAKEYEKSLEYFEEWAIKVKNEGAHTSSGLKEWHRYGQALVAMGRKDEGIQLMIDQLELNEKLLVNFQLGYEIFYENAGIYSFLGKKKLAYKYLEKFDETNRWEDKIYFIQMDPLFDNIRDDEEFKTIINKELEENRKIREEIARLEAAGEL